MKLFEVRTASQPPEQVYYYVAARTREEVPKLIRNQVPRARKIVEIIQRADRLYGFCMTAVINGEVKS
jgi:hypothetical protein